MKITKNFTLEEFADTDYKEFYCKNLQGCLEYYDKILRLAQILQALRSHYRQPVIITSGFRCYGLNKWIGGSLTSQHTKGEAVDFKVKNVDCTEVFNFIKNHLGIKYGQLINEFGKAKRNQARWLHLSLGDECDNLIYKDGVYKNG